MCFSPSKLALLALAAGSALSYEFTWLDADRYALGDPKNMGDPKKIRHFRISESQEAGYIDVKRLGKYRATFYTSFEAALKYLDDELDSDGLEEYEVGSIDDEGVHKIPDRARTIRFRPT
ncbi:Uu.00g058350.m01.CDS01 [Anthostomella pinea]|uniref:Uu.00g058350.m01.CDS01 n=1 Tax=Anthostomella pinea TaxID=933095 RepID=A0AAI8YMD6_9PEZI|nr:Uu.00g058350.m01.CDS01 [Anthostomella pinea]